MTYTVASYYGFACLSMRTLLGGWVRNGLPRRLNMSNCELLAQLFTDPVHPGAAGGGDWDNGAALKGCLVAPTDARVSPGAHHAPAQPASLACSTAVLALRVKPLRLPGLQVGWATPCWRTG